MLVDATVLECKKSDTKVHSQQKGGRTHAQTLSCHTPKLCAHKNNPTALTHTYMHAHTHKLVPRPFPSLYTYLALFPSSMRDLMLSEEVTASLARFSTYGPNLGCSLQGSMQGERVSHVITKASPAPLCSACIRTHVRTHNTHTHIHTHLPDFEVVLGFGIQKVLHLLTIDLHVAHLRVRACMCDHTQTTPT